MTFFRKNFHFEAENSDDLYFYGILLFSAVNLILCKIDVYDPYLAEKSLFHNKTFLHDTLFSHFVLCNASDNTTSRNIEGRMHGPSPTSNFRGTVSPVLLKSPPMPTRN